MRGSRAATAMALRGREGGEGLGSERIMKMAHLSVHLVTRGASAARDVLGAGWRARDVLGAGWRVDVRHEGIRERPQL
jgi:hypothetical protein